MNRKNGSSDMLSHSMPSKIASKGIDNLGENEYCQGIPSWWWSKQILQLWSYMAAKAMGKSRSPTDISSWLYNYYNAWIRTQHTSASHGHQNLEFHREIDLLIVWERRILLTWLFPSKMNQGTICFIKACDGLNLLIRASKIGHVLRFAR